MAAYNFGEKFQRRIIILLARDEKFSRMTQGLVETEFFTEAEDRFLSDLIQNHRKKHGQNPDETMLTERAKQELEADSMKAATIGSKVKTALGQIYADISMDDGSVAVQVEAFCQYTKISSAFLNCVGIMEEAVDAGRMEKFQELKKELDLALAVGMNRDISRSDFIGQAEVRHDHREAIARGEIKHDTISTGLAPLDAKLRGGGFGRREIAILSAGPKMGKTAMALSFGVNAMQKGMTVLVVSLEVSSSIIADRLDANISSTPLNLLVDDRAGVKERVKSCAKSGGSIYINDFPTGTFSVADLHRLIDQYGANGIVPDMVILDYLNLMKHDAAEDHRLALGETTKQLRATAHEYNHVMLTCTQLNRNGSKSAVGQATDIADSFEVVRIADLLLTINMDADDREANQARVYCAAARNGEGDFTITVNQDLSKMQSLISVEAVS